MLVGYRSSIPTCPATQSVSAEVCARRNRLYLSGAGAGVEATTENFCAVGYHSSNLVSPATQSVSRQRFLRASVYRKEVCKRVAAVRAAPVPPTVHWDKPYVTALASRSRRTDTDPTPATPTRRQAAFCHTRRTLISGVVLLNIGTNNFGGV
jgi:hypothetical protein